MQILNDYSCKKAPSRMFDWVLNTPLTEMSPEKLWSCFFIVVRNCSVFIGTFFALALFYFELLILEVFIILSPKKHIFQ